eukprot:scaffold286882_cov13-Tisochrysis_lutea.AAC.1
MEEQQQQMLATQQQLFLASNIHGPGPTAAPYMAGLKPSVAKRVAAYLEGMSLQQLRTLKPSGRKDVLSVRLQVCDTLSAHFIQSRMGPAQAGNKGFRGFLRCAYASGFCSGSGCCFAETSSTGG